MHGVKRPVLEPLAQGRDSRDPLLLLMDSRLRGNDRGLFFYILFI